MLTGMILVAMGLVVVAMFVAIYRIERGPSTLDRAVATDVITAAVVALVALVIAMTGQAGYIPMLAVLTLVGFLATVTIARFTTAERSDESRILTPDELARMLEEEEMRPDDAAPVHGPDAPTMGEEES